MRPLVPVFISLIVGTLLAPYIELKDSARYFLFALSLTPLFISIARPSQYGWVTVAPPFFVIGVLLISPYIRPELPANHIKNFIQESTDRDSPGIAFEGRVLQGPEYSNERTRFEVDVGRVLSGGAWKDATGKALVTIDGHVDIVTKGDYAVFIGRLNEPFGFGNPGEFDYAAMLKRRGIYAMAFVKDGLLVSKAEEGAGPTRWVEHLRARIRGFIDGSSTRHKEPLKALIIGEQRGIEKGLRDAFARTGTAHILSISGLHAGIVALFFYRLFFSLLKLSERALLSFNARKLAMGLSLGPVVVYGLLSGFPVPAQRAVIMVAAFIATFMLNRGRDWFNVLALAGVIIVLAYPHSAWDISFQLSFASVAGIIYLVPRLRKRLEISDNRLKGRGRVGAFFGRLWNRSIAPALLVTISASLATAPLVAWHFNMVSLAGLFANMIAVPVSALIIPLLLISSFFSFLWQWPAEALLALSGLLFEIMARVIRSFSSLPFSSIRVTTPTLLEIALLYALAIALVNIRRVRISVYIAVGVFIAILVDFGYWTYKAQGDGALRATFISVGQGESTLIEFPDNRRMLIDGGGGFKSEFDAGERIVGPFLWSRKIGSIDYMVASHAQLDHIGGLKFIVDNFGVKEFWWNGVGDLKGLGDSLTERGVLIRVVGKGRELPVDDVGGVRVEALHPLKDYGFNTNNMSLVLRLTYGRDGILFTGDIGEEGEGALAGEDIKATVLKAPHHGSKGSSKLKFIQKVGPSVVVVSAGRNNRFGFPNKETLETYSSVKARVFRTDLDGAITIETRGNGLQVSRYLTP
ncbi:MAG: DNA internalization-related competence protein ComEC/Rec2 [Deltaproteobacteria bacterium GWB2_55_19]|nr:MAG: DNA internalization-related competence protein ComEC/Rec2 [Deltaproteobacteria bacterium GWB2_55_19]